jgi:hypothetical protein
LRFIPLSLRRTADTPHSTGFARLELGLFTKPSVVMTFYDFIFIDRRYKRFQDRAAVIGRKGKSEFEKGK